MTRKRSSGKGPGRRGTRRVPEYGCLVVFMAFALAVGGLFFIACGGVDPPPLDCRVLGCPEGSVCTQLDDGTYVCRPVPPCSAENPCSDGQICVDGKCVPKPPWKCELDMPGCHETTPPQMCSSEESPCWYNPTQNPEHCEEGPACTLPQPQCAGPASCDCYEGQTWKACDPGLGCRFPQGLGGKITKAASNPGNMGSIVNKAMAAVAGCAVGQEPCPISVPVDVWFGAVCEQLRAKGYCCGRHVDTPLGHDVCPPGSGCTDQISVKRTDFCDGKPHENYRVINVQEDGVRWYPYAKLDAWNVDCGSQGQCVPSLTGIRRRMNLHCPGDDPSRKWCDHTPGEGDLARCQAIGLGCMPGTGGDSGKRCIDRHDCPVQTEGHPLRHVCENEFYGWPGGQAEPTWSSDGRVVMRTKPDGTINRAMAYTPDGTWIKVCAADGTCAQVGN